MKQSKMTRIIIILFFFNKKTLVVFTSLCRNFFLIKYLWTCFIYKKLWQLYTTYHVEDRKKRQGIFIFCKKYSPSDELIKSF